MALYVYYSNRMMPSLLKFNTRCLDEPVIVSEFHGYSVLLYLSLCLNLGLCLCFSFFVFLSLCVSVCLSLSVCLSVCLSVSLCLSVCLSVCLSARLFVFLFGCLLVHLRQYLSLTFYLYDYMSQFLCMRLNSSFSH